MRGKLRVYSSSPALSLNPSYDCQRVNGEKLEQPVSFLQYYIKSIARERATLGDVTGDWAGHLCTHDICAGVTVDSR